MRRKATLTRCRNCLAVTVAGLDADSAALETHVDPTPLSRHGEIRAALVGRRIYRLDTDQRLWAIDRWRITTDPQPGDHLLAQHLCNTPIPATWIAPEPTPTPAHTEEPMF